LFAMVISWIALAVGQLSVAGLPLIDVASNVTSGASLPAAPPITPGEPSTLIEAVIGTVLIAAYLVCARHLRGRRSALRISKPAGAGSGRKAA
jgi:hypothetical protein